MKNFYKIMTALLCAIGSVLVFGMVTDEPGTANYVRGEFNTELFLGMTVCIALLALAITTAATIGVDNDEKP